MDIALIVIGAVVGAGIIFFYLGWLMNTKTGKKSLVISEERAKMIVVDAEKKIA